jgi:hypothetical protein
METESRWLSSVRAMPRARRVSLGAAVCLFLGITILLLGSRIIDTSKPHLYQTLNDQIAYINVARSLLTKGTLQSNTVLPATLWQKNTNDFLYMPGNPAAIALSYKLFGIGPFQSIIPSLVSYLIAMLAIYFIGVRFYSPTVGLVASLLFALYPPALFFAFTAMAELTFVAAFTAAVCACLYLPDRWRPWLGPLCLAVPFLFRETAAFVALPLGLFFWLERRDKFAWRALVFVALSVVLLAAIYRSDFSAGRPSLFKATIFGEPHAIYDDAPGQQAASNPTLKDWARVIPVRSLQNLRGLLFDPSVVPWSAPAKFTLLTMMVLAGLAAIMYRDKLAWSFSALNMISLTALVTLYGTNGYAGVRHLLFAYAVSVVVVASLLVRVASRVVSRRVLTVLASISVIVVLVLTLAVVRNIYHFFAAGDEIDRRQANALESVGHDNTRLLVTPYQLAVLYRYNHFPVVWSFPPNNQPTLEILAARYDIGTMILDGNSPLLQDPAMLATLGFYKEGGLTVDDFNYVVYKRGAR